MHSGNKNCVFLLLFFFSMKLLSTLYKQFSIPFYSLLERLVSFLFPGPTATLSDRNSFAGSGVGLADLAALRHRCVIIVIGVYTLHLLSEDYHYQRLCYPCNVAQMKLFHFIPSIERELLWSFRGSFSFSKPALFPSVGKIQKKSRPCKKLIFFTEKYVLRGSNTPLLF